MTDQPLSGASVSPTAARTPIHSASAATAATAATAASAPEGPDVGHEFFRPRSAVWWLFCAALAVATPGISMQMASPLRGAQGSLWMIAPLFVVTFALFVWLALRADPYRARRRWILVLALAYGATVPTWLAVHANAHLSALSAKLLPSGDGADWSSAIAGPTSEEWGKMLGVVIILLIASTTLRRPMHGLLVGAFVGLGFQIFENVTYAAQGAFSDANSDLHGAFSITVLRSLIGVSSHWLYTGISGVGVAFLLGRTVHRRSLGARVGIFVGLYLVAWGLHFLWNSPAPGAWAAGLLPAKMVLGIVAFLLVARVAWKQERAFLAEADDAVTRDGFAGVVPAGVRSAIGTRKQRRRALKAVRRGVRAETGSRKAARRAKRATKKARRRYLDTLQAWGRRGTGVDAAIRPPEGEDWAATAQPHAAMPVLRQRELAANPFAAPLEPDEPFVPASPFVPGAGGSPAGAASDSTVTPEPPRSDAVVGSPESDADGSGGLESPAGSVGQGGSEGPSGPGGWGSETAESGATATMPQPRGRHLRPSQPGASGPSTPEG